MRKKSIIRYGLLPLSLLLIPLIAMQFSDEVEWDIADFLIAGGLLFGAGTVYAALGMRSSVGAFRAAVATAVVTGLALIWMNLAIGIIGSQGNPANVVYVVVLAIGVVGAAMVRIRPRGMVYVMSTMAIVQALSSVVALVLGEPSPWVLNGVFVLLWLTSALLFRTAAAKPA